LAYQGAVPPRAADILGALLREIEVSAQAPLILVLDDFHRVDDSPTAEIVQLFLDQLPLTIHVALLSRSKPLLNFGVLAAQRRLEDLSRDDLRFQVEETHELLASSYSPGTAERAAELTEAMEGWITGVVLAAETQTHAQSLPRAESEELQDWIYHYLATELFDLQPPHLQQCLLACSVFDDLFDADLLRRMTAPHAPEQVLAEADRRNLFLSRLAGGAYRLHQRFRDFLRTRLEGDERQAAALQRAAATAFLERGDKRAAVEHFLRGNAPKLAARCLDTIGDAAFLDSHTGGMAPLLDALGPEVLHQHPRLMLLRARAALNAGDQPSARTLVTKVLGAARQPLLLATAHVVQAEVERLSGLYDAAIKSCSRALTLVRPNNQAQRAYALRVMAVTQFDAEQLDGALASMHEAEVLYEALRDLPGLAYLENIRGCVLSDLGQHAAAEASYRRAISMWQEIGHGGREALSLNNLGWQYYCVGKLEQSEAVLQRAHDLGKRSAAPFAWFSAATSLGEVARDRGDFETAFRYYHEALALCEGFSRRDMVITRASIASAHLLRNDLAAAERELEGVPHEASDRPTAVACRAYAMLLHRQGLYREAETVLTGALHFLSAAEKPLAHFQLGLTARTLGDVDGSDRHFAQALEIIRQTGYVESLPAQASRCIDELRQFASAADSDSPIHELLQVICQRSRSNGSRARGPQRQPARPQSLVISLLSSATATSVDGRPVARWDGALPLLVYLIHRREATALQAASDLWETDTSGQTESDVVRSLVNHFQVMKYRLKKILGADAIVQVGPRPLRYRLHPDIQVTYDVTDILAAGAALAAAPAARSQVAEIEQLLGQHPASFALAGDFAGPADARGAGTSWVQETACEVELLRVRLLNRQLSLLAPGDAGQRQIRRAIEGIAERTGIGLPELV